MQYLRIIFFVLVIARTLVSSGQTTIVKFTYDENGNRDSRKSLEVEELQSGFSLPANTPFLSPQIIENGSKGVNLPWENLKSEIQAQTIIPEEITKVKIYPNPTKGNLKIEVTNMPPGSLYEMRLYDMSGNLLITKKDNPEFYDLDISYLRDGIYFLRIIINETAYDFKVIKTR